MPAETNLALGFLLKPVPPSGCSHLTSRAPPKYLIQGFSFKRWKVNVLHIYSRENLNSSHRCVALLISFSGTIAGELSALPPLTAPNTHLSLFLVKLSRPVTYPVPPFTVPPRLILRKKAPCGKCNVKAKSRFSVASICVVVMLWLSRAETHSAKQKQRGRSVVSTNIQLARCRHLT